MQQTILHNSMFEMGCGVGVVGAFDGMGRVGSVLMAQGLNNAI